MQVHHKYGQQRTTLGYGSRILLIKINQNEALLRYKCDFLVPFFTQNEL